MKFLRVGNIGSEKPALLDNNIIRDLSSVIKDIDQDTIGDGLINTVKKLDVSKLPQLDNNLRIGASVSNPSKFLGIGLNFLDHALEQNLEPPKEPIIFSKATTCICGPNDEMLIPKNSKKTDWEVEIAFVIGKKGKNIPLAEAENYIFGYCLVCDFSEREWQKQRSGQWIKGKSSDTFGPIGPYIVTKDEIKDLYNLNMSLDVNGKRMQTGNTSKMIHKMNFLTSYASEFMTLMPGDVITTGTPPGVGDSMKPP
ncbi:MAG: FAA hydrolase family protein, partial [Candidatus Fonsibacter lacus]|nr:FAA hydrolase family protein [Candidatus Fonsibacter lacus]